MSHSDNSISQVLGLVFVLFFIAIAGCEDNGKPDLEITYRPLIEFLNSDHCTEELEIHNNTDTSIEIIEAKPSCYCGVVREVPLSVPARQKRALSVRYENEDLSLEPFRLSVRFSTLPKDYCQTIEMDFVPR